VDPPPPHRRDRQGKRQLALPRRRHRPAQLPLTDVTEKMNDTSQMLPIDVMINF
jgi:hypothetical protein